MKKAILALFIGITAISWGQDRMTPELLWKLKRVGNIEVSPDGNNILFSQRTYNLAQNNSKSELFLVNLKGEVKQITDNDYSEMQALWHPTLENTIVYLADPRKDGHVNLFTMKIGEDPVQISFMRESINGYKIAPTGDKVLFIRDVKINAVNSNERYSDLPKSNARVIDNLMYRHWDHYEDGARSHIFFAPIIDGKVQGSGYDIMDGQDWDAPLQPFGGMEQINFNENGNKIVYTCKKMVGVNYAISTNSEIYVYDIITKNTAVLSKSAGYDMNPMYSKDGKKLAWLSMEQDGFEADKNDILVYDYKKQRIENLTAEYDLTVSDFVWDDEGEVIYFKSVKEATYQLFEIEVESKKMRQITDGIHNYTSLAYTNGKLVAGKQSMNHPTDIYLVDIKKGTDEQLTDVNKEIYANLKTGKIEKRWVTTTDGKKELVWVIYPPDFDEKKKYPALLYCQGGPQSAVSQFFSYRWNFQLMAANDYIIIAPNRRGLPGFGQDWNDEISGDWGGQPMRDYLSAVDEIKKEPYIDEERIGAVGASYGGYSVYYLAGIHENRFKCFVSHCGLYNLESWYGTTEELFFANKDIGGPYFSSLVPRSYKQYSPHKLAGNWDTPMLIFHGEKDYRVPVTQGMEAFQVLQLKRIDSRLILFPDENHWVLSPQNGVLWHREYYAWLDKHLK